MREGRFARTALALAGLALLACPALAQRVDKTPTGPFVIPAMPPVIMQAMNPAGEDIVWEISGTLFFGGVLSLVDNTFATPRLQRPLEHGIDLVLHSVTKYLNGHSDVVGGMVVVGDNPELAERLRFMHYALGAVPSPFDSFLVLRGLKTLHLRVDRACENASRIAEWFARHPKIEFVNYPGLPEHPQHALARRQMPGFGGMVTFLPKGGPDAAKRIAERCEIFHLAVSLGGVESLIELPAFMTHRTVPAEIRERVGVVDALVRLSCGVEDPDDLIADLDQAIG